MTEPKDAELIAELEAAGVEFMAFRGGLCGTKEVWVTAGSQDAKKIAQGVRAALGKWGVQPVPAGYALVPVEPTPEMLSVMWVNKNSSLSEAYNSLSEAYSAMLAASPQPVVVREPLTDSQAQAGAVPMSHEDVKALIRQLVEALEGYRRNHNDTQPCDAERAGRAWLEGFDNAIRRTRSAP